MRFETRRVQITVIDHTNKVHGQINLWRENSFEPQEGMRFENYPGWKAEFLWLLSANRGSANSFRYYRHPYGNFSKHPEKDKPVVNFGMEKKLIEVAEIYLAKNESAEMDSE